MNLEASQGWVARNAFAVTSGEYWRTFATGRAGCLARLVRQGCATFLYGLESLERRAGFAKEHTDQGVSMTPRKSRPESKKLGFAAMVSLLLVCFPVQARERLSWDYSGHDKLNALFTSEEGPLYGEKQNRRVYHLRFVVEGESLESWTEILEIIDTHREHEPENAHLWFERFQAQGNETCPSEWTIIDEQADSIIFQRTSKDCPAFDDQDALYRVLYGRQNVFLIFATLKGEMDESGVAGWLNVLRSAEIRR